MPVGEEESIPLFLAGGSRPVSTRSGHATTRRIGCAVLLKQVFGIDIEHCSNCGGELKIIAAILEQPVIEKILTHLGLWAT